MEPPEDIVVRNRRFKYMTSVLDDPSSNYFSLERMQERHPYLHEQLLGRAEPTPYARNMPLSQRLLSNLESDIIEQRRRQQRDEATGQNSRQRTSAGVAPQPMALSVDQASKLILSNFETDDDDIQDERNLSDTTSAAAAAAALSMDDAADEDEGVDDDVDDDDDDGAAQERVYQRSLPSRDIMSADDIARAEQTLREFCRERFMTGNDGDFVDYNDIDNNPRYDDLKQQQQDAEERWFDDDDSDGDVACVGNAAPANSSALGPDEYDY